MNDPRRLSAVIVPQYVTEINGYLSSLRGCSSVWEARAVDPKEHDRAMDPKEHGRGMDVKRHCRDMDLEWSGWEDGMAMDLKEQGRAMDLKGVERVTGSWIGHGFQDHGVKQGRIQDSL